MKKITTTRPLPAAINTAWRIGIVTANFYKTESDQLVEGAKQLLTHAGIPEANITVYEVPGSIEVPLIGAALAKEHAVDALIGFGIIVEGETAHARLLAEAATRGLMDVQLTYRIPFAFEILYVHTLAQAQERAIGDHNKGAEAAHAVLHSLALLENITRSA